MHQHQTKCICKYCNKWKFYFFGTQCDVSFEKAVVLPEILVFSLNLSFADISNSLNNITKVNIFKKKMYAVILLPQKELLIKNIEKITKERNHPNCFYKN